MCFPLLKGRAPLSSFSQSAEIKTLAWVWRNMGPRLVFLASVLWGLSFCNASEVLTPTASGMASGNGPFAFERLFDAQPSLLPESGLPSGTSGGQNMPASPEAYAFIDFGPDFSRMRITRIWMLYASGPPLDAPGFEAMGWSSGHSADGMGSAIEETRLPLGASLIPTPLSSPAWRLEWNAAAADGSPLIPLRRYLLVKTGPAVTERLMELCFEGFHAEQGLIEPVAAGTAIGGAWMDLSRAFDGNVTWNQATGLPEGLEGGEGLPAFADRVGYIDFGPNWSQVAITQTWMLFGAWGSGPQLGFSQAWWDDDLDGANDSGLVETRFNMGCGNLAALGEPRWVNNHDFRETPLIPKARYLMLKGAEGMSNRPLEYLLNGSFSGSGSDGGTGSDDWITVLEPPVATPVLSIPQPQVFAAEDLELIEEIQCGETPDSSLYREFRSSDIEVQQILGRQARVLKNTASETNYFAYKMGVGKALEAGAAYLLTVDYPDDVDRTFVIINTGDESRLGFATGKAAGDSVQPRYVSIINESLNYGFTGTWQRWQQFFHLHEKVVEFGIPRDDQTQVPWESQRTQEVSGGFWVSFVQQAQQHGPRGNGMAVARVALYKVKNPRAYDQPLNLPQGLPQRHLFSREEMSDGAVGNPDPGLQAYADGVKWYENRAKRLKFLGMNTFATDMLEFGHVQGWDSSKYPDWYTASRFPDRWSRTLSMLNRDFPELNVLPYYEYSGGTASNADPALQGLGRQRRARPLYKEPDPNSTWANDTYTFIGWTEERNVDITDPDTLADFRKVLECTIVDQLAGARPLPLPFGSPDPSVLSGTGTGYIDLGPNWADLRIRGTWTRSRKWGGGPATPYARVYWHSNWEDFRNQATPAAVVEETALNFVTKEQIHSHQVWSLDGMLPSSAEVIPKGRYLVLRTGDSFTPVTQFMITGRLASEAEGTLHALQVSSAGTVDGHPYLHNLANAFDEGSELDAERHLNFLGAWIRPRISDFPISFADATRARYANARGVAVPTKDALKGNPALYADYFSWWKDQRKAFLAAVRDYLRPFLGDDALVLYTWDYSEPGVVHPTKSVRMISQEPDYWQGKLPGSSSVAYPFRRAVEENLHFEAMTQERSNSEGAEWGHTHPRGDPLNYKGSPNIYMTYVLNKLYSVANPEWMEAYENGGGLAMLHHFSLNENNTNDSSSDWEGMGNRIAGYFVTNMEANGPYSMLPEARALAAGNPYHLGYLSSNLYNRGFPGYARAFNANYLALPALPMDRVEGYTSDARVVLRRIVTPNHGIWIAAINIGFEDQHQVKVTFPYSGCSIRRAVDGGTVEVDDANAVTLDLYPGQLITWHLSGEAVPYVPGAEAVFHYTETDDGITLTGLKAPLSGIEIPGSIHGKAVRGIAAHAFMGQPEVTSLSIPSSVREIGAFAFAQCPNLVQLQLAEGLENIATQAFAFSPNLTHVALPASLTDLDPTAFIGCARLVQVTVASGNLTYAASEGVLYSKDMKTLCLYPAAKTNPDFVVPESVTTLAPWAFANAANLETVVLPAGLQVIQTGAFWGCEHLQTLSAP
jgi:hypothetical protein